MFEVAEGYEEMMGRWSRKLAPLFLEFVGVQDGEKVLDVGCGRIIGRTREHSGI